MPERNFKSRFGVFISIGIVLALGIVPSLALRGAPASSLNFAIAQSNYSSFLLSLLNRDRANYGSPNLQENEKLDRVAQAYAEYLLRSGFFGHVDPFGRNPQDRAALYGISAGISENLAYEESNYEDKPTLIHRAEEGMMNEPPNQMNHRFNILNPRSRYVGLGIANAGDKTIVVQEFTSELP